MKINIDFENGTSYWQNLVTENARKAALILSDPAFIQKIRSWAGFDYCGDTPDQVADTIATTREVTIRVGFYSKWLTRAIAYEQDGAAYFNTRKEAYGAGSVGNVAHELMHALGYSHNGNSPGPNQNTVPYRIGQWAEGWEIAQTRPEDAKALMGIYSAGTKSKAREALGYKETV